jgi:hypothetical protein
MMHTDPAEERDRVKEGLTKLFNEAKNTNTHIIVERIVADIDDIVKKVRFRDRQHTTHGERLVQRELTNLVDNGRIKGNYRIGSLHPSQVQSGPRPPVLPPLV